MPIRKEGTPEHEHFRALYEEILKPAVETLGYETKRADDFKKGGAITKDIVLPLAEADLVVADLTALNPNVFYELGVRHSLRAQGTIMIMDDSQDSIPFDIGAYRVIRFKSDLSGLGRLRRELEKFVRELDPEDVSRRDNPVHDWLPTLPANALAATKDSRTEELTNRINRLQTVLREYEDTFGKLSDKPTGRHSALSVVTDALAEAKDGNLPSDLLREAEAALQQRDNKSFLEVLRRAMTLRAGKLTTRQWLTLVSIASNLELEGVEAAMLDHARNLFPNDPEVRRVHLEMAAHSSDPVIRKQGRQDLIKELGIEITPEQVKIPEMESEQRQLFGILLDAFHTDGLDDDASRIAKGLVDTLPDSALALRNYARALGRAGKLEDSIRYYQKAICAPDADDTSAIWLGNELHNRKRHVDAAEVYARACLLDSYDARGFVHFAEEIAIAKSKEEAGNVPAKARKLPTSLDKKVVQESVFAALSCRMLRGEDLERATRAFEIAEVGISLPQLVAVLQGAQGQGDGESPNSLNMPRFTRSQRITMAKKWSELLQSELTQAQG